MNECKRLCITLFIYLQYLGSTVVKELKGVTTTQEGIAKLKVQFCIRHFGMVLFFPSFHHYKKIFFSCV